MSRDKIYFAPSVFGIDSRLRRIESPTPIAQNPSPPLYSTSETQEQSSAERNPATSAGECLLSALWRSPDRHHQIGTLDRQSNMFRNIPIKDVADAVTQALKLSDEGSEVFFACAEYLTPDSRTAANASGACGFWLDVDCGEDKAATGKGYASIQDAKDSLNSFCQKSGLPTPTHNVHSGGGLHVYWTVDGTIPRDIWQAHAKQLKALTKALAFHADDSRTADIASVLRVPGTLSQKYTPSRDVTLEHESAEVIESSIMLDAIADAHDRLCCTVAIKPSGCPSIATIVTNINGSADADKFGSPDIVKLESALAYLDPDCDEPIWKLRRLAPLAEAARTNTEMEVELYGLARSWSSGELRGNASMKWCSPGGNGLTGEQVFDSVWLRFLTSNYPGVPTTLGTIYYDAIHAGWDPDDQFKAFTAAAAEDE